jgi:hypothetical protein
MPAHSARSVAAGALIVVRAITRKTSAQKLFVQATEDIRFTTVSCTSGPVSPKPARKPPSTEVCSGCLRRWPMPSCSQNLKRMAPPESFPSATGLWTVRPAQNAASAAKENGATRRCIRWARRGQHGAKWYCVLLDCGNALGDHLNWIDSHVCGLWSFRTIRGSGSHAAHFGEPPAGYFVEFAFLDANEGARFAIRSPGRVNRQRPDIKATEPQITSASRPALPKLERDCSLHLR